MQNEIPAGTKVKVAVTQKGVTTFQDAEVLAHMDGLVHVNLNGDAVSVDPSQIRLPDAPIEGMQSTTAPAENSGNAQIVAELIAQLTARVSALESQVADIQDRLLEIAKPIDAAAPAAQKLPINDESTALVAPAEPTGEVKLNVEATPETAADASGV